MLGKLARHRGLWIVKLFQGFSRWDSSRQRELTHLYDNKFYLSSQACIRKLPLKLFEKAVSIYYKFKFNFKHLIFHSWWNISFHMFTFKNSVTWKFSSISIPNKNSMTSHTRSAPCRDNTALEQKFSCQLTWLVFPRHVRNKFLTSADTKRVMLQLISKSLLKDYCRKPIKLQVILVDFGKL